MARIVHANVIRHHGPSSRGGGDFRSSKMPFRVSASDSPVLNSDRTVVIAESSMVLCCLSRECETALATCQEARQRSRTVGAGPGFRLLGGPFRTSWWSG